VSHTTPVNFGTRTTPISTVKWLSLALKKREEGEFGDFDTDTDFD
jgi:hypothetical protein